jgi:hypothetical protein
MQLGLLRRWHKHCLFELGYSCTIRYLRIKSNSSVIESSSVVSKGIVSNSSIVESSRIRSESAVSNSGISTSSSVGEESLGTIARIPCSAPWTGLCSRCWCGPTCETTCITRENFTSTGSTTSYLNLSCHLKFGSWSGSADTDITYTRLCNIRSWEVPSSSISWSASWSLDTIEQSDVARADSTNQSCRIIWICGG